MVAAFSEEAGRGPALPDAVLPAGGARSVPVPGRVTRLPRVLPAVRILPEPPFPPPTAAPADPPAMHPQSLSLSEGLGFKTFIFWVTSRCS